MSNGEATFSAESYDGDILITIPYYDGFYNQIADVVSVIFYLNNKTVVTSRQLVDRSTSLRYHMMKGVKGSGRQYYETNNFYGKTDAALYR